MTSVVKMGNYSACVERSVNGRIGKREYMLLVNMTNNEDAEKIVTLSYDCVVTNTRYKSTNNHAQ